MEQHLVPCKVCGRKKKVPERCTGYTCWRCLLLKDGNNWIIGEDPLEDEIRDNPHQVLLTVEDVDWL